MTDINDIVWGQYTRGNVDILRAQLAALSSPQGLSLFFHPTELGRSLTTTVKEAVRIELQQRLSKELDFLSKMGFSGEGIPAIEPNKSEPVNAEQPAPQAPVDHIEITEAGALALEAAAKADAEKTARSQRASAAADARWSRVRKAARKQARQGHAAKSGARNVKHSPAKKAAKKTVKRKR